MSESVNITLSPYSIPNKTTKILRLKGKLGGKTNNENFPNRQNENCAQKMKISHKPKNNFFPLSELSNHSNNSDNSKPLNGNEFVKIQPPKSQQTSAVARRNARERNRVKQVNNGFAILRQHIPDEVAEAYEAVGGRGASKKLSKVETLRMAVEYIRSLEKLLDLDLDQSENYSLNSFKSESHDDGEGCEDRDELDDELDLIENSNNNNNENCDSFTSITNSSSIIGDGVSSLGDDQYFIQYQNIAFLNDRQYICIPNGDQQNTVQFIKLENGNDENLAPHIIINSAMANDDLVPAQSDHISYLHETNMYHDDPALAAAATTKQYILDAATMNYSNIISPLHIITPASSISSPNSYSGQSLSPVANNELITAVATTTINTPSNTSTMGSELITTTVSNRTTHLNHHHHQHLDHHHQLDTMLDDGDDECDNGDDDDSNEYYDKIYTMTSEDDYNRHHSSRLLMQALPPIGSIKKELDYH